MSKDTKSQILSKVADLLDKFSDRLVRIGAQTGKNTAAIGVLENDTRLAIGALREQTAEKTGSLERSIDTLEHQCVVKIEGVKKENDDREARQTARDQNNVQALVNLRDSTAKAFNAVKGDMEQLLRTTQRLNERVGQAESKAADAITASANPRMQTGLPSGHVWVNKKLTGVYDTTDDLETRVKKLEALLALYEGLRKAQNDLAVANGAFLAGPKV